MGWTHRIGERSKRLMSNSRKRSKANRKAAPPAKADEALDVRLRENWLTFARAEQAIAKYLLSNLHDIPFETGAVIAANTGVSEASVARFARRLGYADFKEMKRALRGHARTASVGLDSADARYRIGGTMQERLARSLEMEQRALAAVYDLTSGEKWARIVDLLSKTNRLHCVGFQAVKGLALDFSTKMKWVRGGVTFAEGTGGTYSEILTGDTASSCVLLVDTAEYASMTFRLCEQIKRRGIPLVVITDKYSHWARSYTDLALEVSTRVDLYWDSMAPVSSLLNLLIHAVAERLGDAAQKRMDGLEEIAESLRTFRRIPKRRSRRSGTGRVEQSS
jgi:DNA-binding MurR/RpiR family transcriptional regulator